MDDNIPGKSQHSWLGRGAFRKFEITEGVIDRFARLSGDLSPIHMDDAAAQERGLRKRVAHGALQAAFLSSIVGMDLPGPDGLLQSLSLQFRRPCYAGETLSMHLKVAEVHESVRTVILKVKILNQDGELVASGRVQSGVTRW
jgi:3-hydroxybutyryl-CoA dehydratase